MNLFQNNFVPSLNRKFSVSVASQKQFLDDLAKKLGLERNEDWYDVKQATLKLNGGTWLLKEHGNIFKILKSVYPEYKWKLWEFKHSPEEIWKEKEIQREFLDDFAHKYGITQFEKWYPVKGDDLRNHGGSILLKMYQEEHWNLISNSYPEFKWNIFLFEDKPKGFWHSKENRRKFFDFIYKDLKLKTMEDWYQVSLTEVIEYGGITLVANYFGNSLNKALEDAYPGNLNERRKSMIFQQEYEWEEAKWARRYEKRSQPHRSLFSKMRIIFPNE